MLGGAASGAHRFPASPASVPASASRLPPPASPVSENLRLAWTSCFTFSSLTSCRITFRTPPSRSNFPALYEGRKNFTHPRIFLDEPLGHDHVDEPELVFHQQEDRSLRALRLLPDGDEFLRW